MTFSVKVNAVDKMIDLAHLVDVCYLKQLMQQLKHFLMDSCVMYVYLIASSLQSRTEVVECTRMFSGCGQCRSSI